MKTTRKASLWEQLVDGKCLNIIINYDYFVLPGDGGSVMECPTLIDGRRPPRRQNNASNYAGRAVKKVSRVSGKKCSVDNYTFLPGKKKKNDGYSSPLVK